VFVCLSVFSCMFCVICNKDCVNFYGNIVGRCVYLSTCMSKYYVCVCLSVFMCVWVCVYSFVRVLRMFRAHAQACGYRCVFVCNTH